jgi:molecular chaperone DnaK
VALGACVQAAVLSGEVTDVLLLDVTPLSLGIETLGGVATVLIEKNTTIPCNKKQTFSTADDNQRAVTIHVVQGERKQAAQNKSLGRFDLNDIPPAPRGMPQIEVSFDLNADGILNVSAKDVATGKQQSIVIKASSGLSEDEIAKMVREAESHAAEDKKFEELVTARNQADGLVHATRKSLTEGKDKVEAGEKEKIEAAITALEAVIKGDDLQAIKDKSEELSKAASGLAQRMYEDASKQGAAGGGTEGGAGASSGSKKAGDDAVDAEFEEVKDDK